MWSFTTLAPGMSPLPSTGGWAMRGSFVDACSPAAAVAVDSAHPDDAAHFEANREVVASSLASPNRIVLQTSTHSFSARAGRVAGGGIDDVGNGHTVATGLGANGVQRHSCQFTIQQLQPPPSDGSSSSSFALPQQQQTPSPAEDDPSILIGLSCAYLTGKSAEEVAKGLAETQHQYDTRTLSTPLLWEEPRSFFIDCRRSGMFLWSDDGVEFGRKIADKCLEDVAPSHSSTSSSSQSISSSANPTVLREATIEMSWGDGNEERSRQPSIQLAMLSRRKEETRTDDAHAANSCRDEKTAVVDSAAHFTWKLPFGTVLSDLVPSVTFLTEFCRAKVQ